MQSPEPIDCGAQFRRRSKNLRCRKVIFYQRNAELSGQAKAGARKPVVWGSLEYRVSEAETHIEKALRHIGRTQEYRRCKDLSGAKTVQYPGSIPISGFAPRYARPTHGILSPEPEPLRHAKSQDLQSQEGALHDIRSQDMQNREICKSRKCKPRNMHREYAITVYTITVYAGSRNIPKALSCAVCSLYHSDHHAVWSKL